LTPGDQYIEGALARHELKPGLLSALAVSTVVTGLRKWANVYLNRIVYTADVHRV
jgi:hypothetical protein